MSDAEEIGPHLVCAPDTWRRKISAALAAARQEGAEEMRERAARRCELEASRHGSLNDGNVRRECAALIRALTSDGGNRE